MDRDLARVYVIGILLVVIGVPAAWTAWEKLATPAIGRRVVAPALAQGNGIAVVEATYGMSCKDAKVSAPAMNTVATGNATKAIATACANKGDTCSFQIDMNTLGDPANGCQKDFVIRWQCGADPATRESSVAAEAHGKTLTMACPPK